MPGLAGLGLDQHPLAVVFENAQATAGHAQHQGFDIAGEQQVAAAANGHQRQAAARGLGQGFTHLVVVARLGEQPGFDIDAEGIERFERDSLLQSQAHRRPLISASSASLACSIRSSTCSKPSTPP